MDWFLYDGDLSHERVNESERITASHLGKNQLWGSSLNSPFKIKQI